MPLIADLNIALEGGTLTADLNAQAANLNAIIQTVTNLINNPPSDVGDLSTLIGELPLPEFAGAGDFADTLNSIRAAVPTDLASITGGFTAQLGELQSSVGTDIVAAVQSTLNAAMAIYSLTRIDLSCMASANGGTPLPPPAVPPPPPPPGDPPAPPPAPPPAAASAVTKINATLDLLPSPLNMEGVLNFIHLALSGLDRSNMLPFTLPLLDDLRDPLMTLMEWSSGDILAHITATLNALDDFLRGSFDLTLNSVDLDALLPQLPIAQLTEIADDLIAQLNALRTAVQSGDVASTGGSVAAINIRLDQYEALVLQAGVIAQIETVADQLRELPDDIDSRMGWIVSTLQPGVSLGMFDSFQPSAEIDAALTVIGQQLDTIVAWFQDLVDQIDLSAVQAPITEIAENARGLVDSLDEGLVTITLEVQALFGEVESLLNTVDIAALTADLQEAINQFRDAVIAELQNLFEPARQAVETVISQIDGAVDNFDPQQVIAAFESAIDSIAGVLDSESVRSAMNTVRSTIEAVTTAIEEASFAPVTDEVIATIDEVGQGVQAALSGDVSPLLKEALGAALSLIPTDLQPITDPLIGELDELIQAGPIPLLESIKDAPQMLLDRVRQFDPGALVGAALDEPFNALITQMDAFSPRALLDPLEAEIEALKDRLSEDANPGKLLQPLEPLFAQLLVAVNGLNPAVVIAPIEAAITGAVDGILDALPLDEVFAPIDAALRQVRLLIEFGILIRSTLDKLADLLEGFADAPAQITAWLNPILDRIDSVNAASLQPLLDDIEAAVGGFNAVGISALVNQTLDPAFNALNALNPQGRLTLIVQAHARISLASLPDSPEKTAIADVLARMSPAQPSFGVSFRALLELQVSLAGAKTALQSLFGDWDTRYLSADSPLTLLRNLQVGQLRQWVASVIEPLFVQPLGRLFTLLTPLNGLLGVVASNLANLITSLETQINNLLLGPNSLGGIRDAMQGLIDRLQGLNLDFLENSLTAVFDQVRGKLEAISPAAIRATISAAFDSMLDSLSLDLILPQDQIDTLNAAYDQVVEKLKALSPGAIVTDAVNPIYEERIIPLIEAFDISELINAILERLQGLKDDLRVELDRVNDAFQNMLQSISSSGISVSVSV